jgi:NAD(P)-dependent dehydrogenase (short-subunit alcohol dehydrogenase family)|tara:strand:+ start:1140 stop:1970 length:831 start_codon:yes stop_codon:yes gene_type:complete
MSNLKFNLENKTSLITGAAGLLGEQHARALLEIGSHIILTDINVLHLKKLKEDLSLEYPPEKIHVIPMDVTKLDDVDGVLKQLHKKNIFVDVLINNAAIDPKVGTNGGLLESSRLENFSSDDWDLQLNVGLKGAFLCTKVFGHDMSLRGGGVILNISSDLSVIAPDQKLYRKPGLDDSLQPVKPVTYSVVKTGLIGLTRYTSTYWTSQGIRCNALSPGGVYTDQDQEFVGELENRIPMGRMAKIDEYHSTIQYLCSDASAYLNGQNIVVDGGRSVL